MYASKDIIKNIACYMTGYDWLGDSSTLNSMSKKAKSVNLCKLQSLHRDPWLCFPYGVPPISHLF